MNYSKWIEFLTKGNEGEKEKIYKLQEQNYGSLPMAIMEYRRNLLVNSHEVNSVEVINNNRSVSLTNILNNDIDNAKEALQELFLEYYDANEWHQIKYLLKKENITLPDILLLHIKNPTDRLLSILKLI